MLRLIALLLVLTSFLAFLQACTRAAMPAPSPTQPREEGSTRAPISTQRPPTAVTVELVAKELKVPWALAFAPDGRLFVTERQGTIRVIKNDQLLEPPLAQLEVAQEGQGGLLGLALDPEFEANGYLYVYHTYRHEPLDASGGRGLRNRVVRLKTLGSVAENPTVILDNIPGGYAHNGGRIKFGPDGRLYIATGDADVPAYAQDLNALAGKILRINKDGSIPQDNPIPGSPIYSLGHRNPLGLTWHPVTGELFATDQGPFRNDEVNRILAGANYGWPEVVGSVGLPQFRDPVILSGIETWGPSSAAFYSGDALPLEWRGRLSLSMLSGQRIVWLDLRPPEYQSIQGRGSLYGRRFGRIGDIIQGPDGNLYFSTNNLDGRGQPREGDDLILRIIPVNGLLGFLPTDWTDSP